MTKLSSLPVGVLLNKYSFVLDMYLRIPQPIAKLLYRFARETFAQDKRNILFSSVFEHIARERIQGDYLEFGVFRGSSVMMAFQKAKHEGLKDMRFFGFDSFSGLPGSEGGVFEEGTMICQQELFLKLLKQYGMDMTRLITIPGYYQDSLSEKVKHDNNLINAAVVNIDCDLYESTKPVLAFLANVLKPGSIVIFDDWYHFDHKEHPEQYGEQRAFEEWPESKNFKFLTSVPGRCAAFVRT